MLHLPQSRISSLHRCLKTDVVLEGVRPGFEGEGSVFGMDGFGQEGFAAVDVDLVDAGIEQAWHQKREFCGGSRGLRRLHIQFLVLLQQHLKTGQVFLGIQLADGVNEAWCHWHFTDVAGIVGRGDDAIGVLGIVQRRTFVF